MKTLYLRDETYTAVCEALIDALAGKELAVDLLVSRFGLDSAQAKAAIADFHKLEAVEIEFREGGSRWRGRGSSITSR